MTDCDIYAAANGKYLFDTSQKEFFRYKRTEWLWKMCNTFCMILLLTIIVWYHWYACGRMT